MNLTPADAENSANWDDTLSPLLLDAMSKVYGYATYSDLCNDDDMPEVWSVADNIAKASEELQRQVQSLIDAARQETINHVYKLSPTAQFKNWKPQDAQRFYERLKAYEQELSHPAPVTKSDKE